MTMDAWLALRLFAIDPPLAGGICLHAAAGPVRDRWLADLRAALAPATPWRHVPSHVDTDRLLGGLDLAATLQLGHSVAQRGLLAEADGGVLILAMAERAGEATVAHVSAALDTGEVLLARDGVERLNPARFGVIALDESAGPDEACAETLLDRLAFHVDLHGISARDLEAAPAVLQRGSAELAQARMGLPAVRIGDDMIEALCAAALALGVGSIRACLLAARVARLSAALAGRDDVAAEDAAAAARLVLSSRATQMPASADDAEAAANEDKPDDADDADDEERDAAPPSDASDRGDENPRESETDTTDSDEPDPQQDDPDHRQAQDSPEDVVLAAATAAIPRDLLARLAGGQGVDVRRSAAGRAGALHASNRRGRPAGVRRAAPGHGARLDVIATLRAAAPWQRVRGRTMEALAGGVAPPVRIRSGDFHISRTTQRGQTTTIFAVDASGSSALQRLAEAKGAVELLLAECYVRRDSVAVIAFRGRGSELLLPPTRSLVRAKRSLAELPGGGGTPLAAGIDAALSLALAVRRRGDTPVVVVLTDGRANVARDGKPGRPQADADALLAARALRAAGLSALLIDTSPQPQPRARDLAAAMLATYLPLPYAGATTLSEAVRRAASNERTPTR